MPNIYSHKTCINCGLTKRSNGVKYCSVKCQLDFQYKEYIKRWLSGKETGLRGNSQTSTMIKRYMIEVRGNKCSRCKNSEWMGNPIPVSLHHIDGNFLNNKIENLSLLCPNCHTFTPNFGRKNKGNGRPRYFLNSSNSTPTANF